LWLGILVCEGEARHQDAVFISLFEMETSTTERPGERAADGETLFPVAFWCLSEVSGPSLCSRRAHASAVVAQ